MNSNIALKLVEDECLDLNLDISRVVEVWHCYILKNEKWLFAVLDSSYYFEVTFNSNKNEFYIDAYCKAYNVRCKLGDREKPTGLNCFCGWTD